MRRVLALLFGGAATIFAILQLAEGRSPEFNQFVANVTIKCRKQAGIDDLDGPSESYTVSKFNEETGEVYLCCEFCACWVNEIGYMENGQWNLENARKINEQKWDDPEKAALNTEIDKTCFDEVRTEGRDECNSALLYKYCKSQLAESLGLVVGKPQPRNYEPNEVN